MIVDYNKEMGVLTLTAEKEKDKDWLLRYRNLLHFPMKDPLDVEIDRQQQERFGEIDSKRHADDGEKRPPVDHAAARKRLGLTSTGHSTEVGMPESTDAQLHPSAAAATPPSHGRGWPQETVPYSTSHVMGGDLEDSSLGRYTTPPTASDDEASHD